MRCCFSMWPKHRFAEIAGRILDKERFATENARKLGREWKRVSWDVEIMDAIYAYAAQQIDERRASVIIEFALAKARAYRDRRFRNRR